MKTLLLFMLIILLTGCNSKEPTLSSLQGLSSSSAPQILYVASLSPDGNYTTGTIDLEVRFTEEVNVIGIPSISVMTDFGAFPATYRSGTGTDTWIFKMNVNGGIVDNDGINLLSPVQLNGGSIFSPRTNEDAILSFLVPNTSGIFLNYNVVLPDGSIPQIMSVVMANNTKAAYKRTEANPVIKVTFSENVTVSIGSAVPFIVINVGGTTYHASFNGFDGVSQNVLKFLIVTDPTMPLDLDGIAFTTEIDLGDSSIKDPSGNIINTDFSHLTPPKIFIIPETLRDWFDANDPLTTATPYVALSKSSALTSTFYGNVTINNTTPKTFQFDIGASLVMDTNDLMYKVLIVYRNSANPNGQMLIGPYNYDSSNGCYLDYRGQEICSSFAGGGAGGAALASLVPDIIADPLIDYGVTFYGGQFRLGPNCTSGTYGCGWYDPSIAGERINEAMDGDGVLTNPTYDYDGNFRYSIVNFNGADFRSMLGDKGFDQEIAEVMYFSDGFSTASTSSDLSEIEAYLATKYGTISQQ